MQHGHLQFDLMISSLKYAVDMLFNSSLLQRFVNNKKESTCKKKEQKVQSLKSAITKNIKLGSVPMFNMTKHENTVLPVTLSNDNSRSGLSYRNH